MTESFPKASSPSSRLRHAIFTVFALSIPLVGAIGLVFYLFICARVHYPLVRSAYRTAWLHDHLFDLSAEQLLATVDGGDEWPASRGLHTVWDTGYAVALSRTLFRPVEMFGQSRYAYQPRLRKLSFVTGLRSGYQEFEVADSPDIRAAVQALDPVRVATATYDDRGFRTVVEDPHADCDARVLFLGDSFTDGLWVDDKDTFVSQYSRVATQASHRQVCSINAGVNGYGSLEEAYVLEHTFEESGRPSVVILMFFANDVDGDFARVISGRLESADLKWNASLAYVHRMSEFCRAHGSSFVLTAIPTAIQFSRPLAGSHYQDILRHFAETEGITFVDLLDGLRAAGKADRFFWPWDPHLTPQGHVAVAKIMADRTLPILETGTPAP